MRISILASEVTRNEILSKATTRNVEIAWKTDLQALASDPADAYLDLLFQYLPERIETLKQLLPATVVIGSVCYTTRQTDPSFIRINAWPGFIRQNVCEIAIGTEANAATAKDTLQALGWQYHVVPDQPGMIAPRILAMVINESYFALEEQVSTRAEIDIAMKLGTNYPFGPFEWAEKIGVHNIRELLHVMSATDERCVPAAALNNQEVGKY